MVKRKKRVGKVKPHRLLRNTSRNVFIGVFVFLGLLMLSGMLPEMITGNVITGQATSLSDDVINLFTGFMNVVKFIAGFLLGEGAADSSGVLFAKIFICLIILGLAYMSFVRVEIGEEHPGWSFVIAISLGILATRFLSANLVKDFLIVPSTTIAVAIISILLFAVLFFLIETSGWLPSIFIKRIAWIFTGILFLGMWYKAGEMTGTGPWVYAVAGGVAFVMVLIEKKIEKIKKRSKFMKEEKLLSEDALRGFREKIEKLNEDLARGGSINAYNQGMKRINKSIDAILKHS